jgi:hypothetical protein
LTIIHGFTLEKAQLLEALATIMSLADSVQDDPRALLELLRELEACHRRITDRYFIPALPNTRHGLFDLLREMEEKGGWSYIPRVHLRQILEQLAE